MKHQLLTCCLPLIDGAARGILIRRAWSPKEASSGAPRRHVARLARTARRREGSRGAMAAELRGGASRWRAGTRALHPHQAAAGTEQAARVAQRGAFGLQRPHQAASAAAGLDRRAVRPADRPPPTRVTRAAGAAWPPKARPHQTAGPRASPTSHGRRRRMRVRRPGASALL